MCERNILSKAYPSWICKECLKKILFIEKRDSQICFRCGSPLSNRCLCPNLNNNIKMLRGIFIYDGVGREIIHKWKYSNIYFIKDYFERLIIRRFPVNYPQFDVVIPIPIHFYKRITRGFNQSNTLAEFISKRFKIKYTPNLILRKRNSKSQSLCKNYKERERNIASAFKLNCNPDNFTNSKILIVDDIITSGSTVNEVAKLFPNSEIYIFTMAMAV